MSASFIGLSVGGVLRVAEIQSEDAAVDGVCGRLDVLCLLDESGGPVARSGSSLLADDPRVARRDAVGTPQLYECRLQVLLRVGSTGTGDELDSLVDVLHVDGGSRVVVRHRD